MDKLEEIKKSAEAIYKYGNDENTVRSEADHIINLCNEAMVLDYEKQTNKFVKEALKERG